MGAGDLRDFDARHLWHPFTQAQTAPAPILIKEAKGAWLTAEDGKKYLDLISSWWVNLHGHAHPKIVQALAEQAAKLEHVIFANFTHEPAIELARRVLAHLPPSLTRVFYSDNGSTAVEVALKMAFQFWSNRGEIKRNRFIAFDGGYHGDTVGAMSAGRTSGFYFPFQELMFDVDIVPFPATWDGDADVEAREEAALAALDRALESAERYAAAIIEPLIQGAGGMRVCRTEFLHAVAARLKRANVLLIIDEVMTGFGRTGAMFACTKAGVAPDILCCAKGITGGFLPLAATITQERSYEAFLGAGVETAFLHGHSYTANPLGCAAGLASLDIFASEDTLSRIAGIERLHRERLAHLLREGAIQRPRVLGSIAAFDADGAEAYGSELSSKLRELSLQEGLLLRPLGGTLYLMPPYCISDAELGAAYDGIGRILSHLR
ncbi:MAG: adenosylmethionine--8-amino-7-oxononanoate transaminase [Alphaproteobacteria bacterium]